MISIPSPHEGPNNLTHKPQLTVTSTFQILIIIWKMCHQNCTITANGWIKMGHMSHGRRVEKQSHDYKGLHCWYEKRRNHIFV